MKTQNGVYKLALPLESCHWSPSKRPRNESHLWTALFVCIDHTEQGLPASGFHPWMCNNNPPIPRIHNIRGHSNPIDNLPKPARGQ